jgi:hypothetical protein
MNYERVKLYFETQFTAFAKGLGKECGLREKADHERMIAHIEREVGILRGTIESQRKTIESQNKRLRGVEAMFAVPGEASTVDRRLS